MSAFILYIITWSGLSRLRVIFKSVAVTKSCNTGEFSKLYAEGLFSSVAKATWLDLLLK
jgi:hypothetical protein